MSNLSELIPAGAGAKSATFVASGTLASGQTVVLKTNGQVEAVAETSQTIASAVTFDAGVPNPSDVTYDSLNNKIVAAYGVSGALAAVVGTISGETISFGTPVSIVSQVSLCSVTFNASAGKVVICYGKSNGIGYGIVGTVSGTSISFGTAVDFNGTSAYSSNNMGSVYDAGSGKTIITFRDGAGSAYGAAVVGTVSGTSISFGTKVIFSSFGNYFGASPNPNNSVYDSVAQKIATFYYQSTGTTGMYSVVGTVSGTSITFGTAVKFDDGKSTRTNGAYDSFAQKIVLAYWGNNVANASIRTATISGTSISFGTRVDYSVNTDVDTVQAVYDPIANVTSVFSGDYQTSSIAYRTATVSGTNVTLSASTAIAATDVNFIASVYDTTAARVVATYSTTAGVCNVIRNQSSNNTSFLGITDEAISSAASGSVIVQGGVITNTGLIPLGPVVGAESVFDSGTTYLTATVYDSNSNKIVVTYGDGGNSFYGTAVVGTVSGTSISFGTPVVFYSGTLDGLSMVFDSSNNKVVAAYRAGSNSYHGYGVVGTVSGTSISFGTAVVFEAANVSSIVTTFDSNLNKVVIAYQDNGNSGHGTAIVGTVSGTSISFGTAVVFEADSSNNMAATFDSNSNKAVIAYRDNGSGVGGLGTAIVGTVSGTSISFGTAAVYSGTGAAADQAMTFDSSSNKVVVAYADGGNSSYGTAVVGTVSGTAISFGTAVVYNASSSSAQAATFDSNLNKVIIAYRRSSPNEGNVSVGTVSGTSISFGNAATFNAANTAYTSMAFDTTNNKTVIAYRDSGDGNKGTSVVINLTSNLAIGTDYFVQSDGTLSTTTSTVPAGRALSATSILLEG